MGGRRCRRVGTIMPIAVFGLLAAAASRGSDTYYLADFEGAGETKPGYSAGTVTINGVSWDLTEALIGTSESDWKNGARSVRLRGYGTSAMTMQEDWPHGIGTIHFRYARYGDDLQAAWRVEYSVDQGQTWTGAGTQFTAGANATHLFAATPGIDQPARIRIRSVAGEGTSNRRLNIDDILLVPPSHETPLVRTLAVDEIGSVGARGLGELLYDGGNPDVETGFVFNTTGDPTINDLVAGSDEAAGENGFFAADMSGLSPGRTYFARAFARNGEQAGYGTNVSFTATNFGDGPTLLPVEKAADGSFTLRWQPLAGATLYRLQMATDDTFASGGRETVFFETLGEVAGETSLADHLAAGGFDCDLDWNQGAAAQAAHLRATSASGGYTNGAGQAASGGANAFFPGTAGEFGFGSGAVPLTDRCDLYLTFAYRKESAHSNAVFAVEWSDDDGASWNPINLRGWPDEGDGTGWNLLETETPHITTGGGADASIRLRWVKQDGSSSLRIDDILLERADGGGSLLPGFDGREAEGTQCRVEGLAPGRYFVRVRGFSETGLASPWSNIESVGLAGGTVVTFE